jgi:hypothetical protein
MDICMGILDKLFGDDEVEYFVVTNAERKKDKPFYCLKISKAELELDYKSESINLHYKFDPKGKKLVHNNAAAKQVEIQDFISKAEWVINDHNRGNAKFLAKKSSGKKELSQNEMHGVEAIFDKQENDYDTNNIQHLTSDELKKITGGVDQVSLIFSRPQNVRPGRFGPDSPEKIKLVLIDRRVFTLKEASELVETGDRQNKQIIAVLKEVFKAARDGFTVSEEGSVTRKTTILRRTKSVGQVYSLAQIQTDLARLVNDVHIDEMGSEHALLDYLSVVEEMASRDQEIERLVQGYLESFVVRQAISKARQFMLRTQAAGVAVEPNLMGSSSLARKGVTVASADDSAFQDTRSLLRATLRSRKKGSVVSALEHLDRNLAQLTKRSRSRRLSGIGHLRHQLFAERTRFLRAVVSELPRDTGELAKFSADFKAASYMRTFHRDRIRSVRQALDTCLDVREDAPPAEGIARLAVACNTFETDAANAKDPRKALVRQLKGRSFQRLIEDASTGNQDSYHMLQLACSSIHPSTTRVGGEMNVLTTLQGEGMLSLKTLGQLFQAFSQSRVGSDGSAYDKYCEKPKFEGVFFNQNIQVKALLTGVLLKAGVGSSELAGKRFSEMMEILEARDPEVFERTTAVMGFYYEVMFKTDNPQISSLVMTLLYTSMLPAEEFGLNEGDISAVMDSTNEHWFLDQELAHLPEFEAGSSVDDYLSSERTSLVTTTNSRERVHLQRRIFFKVVKAFEMNSMNTSMGEIWKERPELSATTERDINRDPMRNYIDSISGESVSRIQVRINGLTVPVRSTYASTEYFMLTVAEFCEKPEDLEAVQKIIREGCVDGRLSEDGSLMRMLQGTRTGRLLFSCNQAVDSVLNHTFLSTFVPLGLSPNMSRTIDINIVDGKAIINHNFRVGLMSVADGGAEVGAIDAKLSFEMGLDDDAPSSMSFSVAGFKDHGLSAEQLRYIKPNLAKFGWDPKKRKEERASVLDTRLQREVDTVAFIYRDSNEFWDRLNVDFERNLFFTNIQDETGVVVESRRDLALEGAPDAREVHIREFFNTVLLHTCDEATRHAILEEIRESYGNSFLTLVRPENMGAFIKKHFEGTPAETLFQVYTQTMESSVSNPLMRDFFVRAEVTPRLTSGIRNMSIRFIGSKAFVTYQYNLEACSSTLDAEATLANVRFEASYEIDLAEKKKPKVSARVLSLEDISLTNAQLVDIEGICKSWGMGKAPVLSALATEPVVVVAKPTIVEEPAFGYAVQVSDITDRADASMATLVRLDSSNNEVLEEMFTRQIAALNDLENLGEIREELIAREQELHTRKLVQLRVLQEDYNNLVDLRYKIGRTNLALARKIDAKLSELYKTMNRLSASQDNLLNTIKVFQYKLSLARACVLKQAKGAGGPSVEAMQADLRQELGKVKVQISFEEMKAEMQRAEAIYAWGMDSLSKAQVSPIEWRPIQRFAPKISPKSRKLYVSVTEMEPLSMVPSRQRTSSEFRARPTNFWQTTHYLLGQEDRTKEVSFRGGQFPTVESAQAALEAMLSSISEGSSIHISALLTPTRLPGKADRSLLAAHRTNLLAAIDNLLEATDERLEELGCTKATIESLKEEFMLSNFGVNEGAVGEYDLANKIGMRIKMGWHNSVFTYDNPAVETLMGVVDGRFSSAIESLSSYAPLESCEFGFLRGFSSVTQITLLMDQIWAENSFADARVGHDQFKMPALWKSLDFWLNILSYVDCMSGKDRTGEVESDAFDKSDDNNIQVIELEEELRQTVTGFVASARFSDEQQADVRRLEKFLILPCFSPEDLQALLTEYSILGTSGNLEDLVRSQLIAKMKASQEQTSQCLKPKKRTKVAGTAGAATGYTLVTGTAGIAKGTPVGHGADDIYPTVVADTLTPLSSLDEAMRQAKGRIGFVSRDYVEHLEAAHIRARNRRASILGSGSTEIARINTGVAAFKVKGGKPLARHSCGFEPDYVRYRLMLAEKEGADLAALFLDQTGADGLSRSERDEFLRKAQLAAETFKKNPWAFDGLISETEHTMQLFTTPPIKVKA